MINSRTLYGSIVALLAACCALFAGQAGAQTLRFNTVIIDAGHGGHDRGGVPGQRVSEKAMALDVSQRLRRKLRAAGYRVIMTRDGDYFVPLGTRVRMARSNSIFVSVHFNSARRRGASGIETYYYSSQSAGLAAAIHRNVVAGSGSENRGIRRRGFYVLRRNSRPAVLVECGFLTNPAEARQAESSAYRDQLASSIARGIIGRSASSANRNSDFVPPSQPFSQVTYNVGSRSDFVRSEPTRRKRSSKRSRSKKKSSSKKSSSKKKSSQSSSDN